MKVYVITTSHYSSEWYGSMKRTIAVVKDEDTAKSLCESYKETISKWESIDTDYEEFDVE